MGEATRYFLNFLLQDIDGMLLNLSAIPRGGGLDSIGFPVQSLLPAR